MTTLNDKTRLKADFAVCGAGWIEVEPLQEETSEFDVFYLYLKELLDVVDEMEKLQRPDLQIVLI